MRCRSRAEAQRGSATAEFAIALPAVVLVLACCLSGIQTAAHQVKLQDAAAVTARALARGDDGAALAARLMPRARLTTTASGDLVCATLTARVQGAAGTLLALELSATNCSLGGGR